METEDQKPKIGIIKFTIINLLIALIIWYLIVFTIGILTAFENINSISIIIEILGKSFIVTIALIVLGSMDSISALLDSNFYLISRGLGYLEFLIFCILCIIACFFSAIKFRLRTFSYPLMVSGYLVWFFLGMFAAAISI